jgi:glycosyltransferase involved in cell wall biosynthesis
VRIAWVVAGGVDESGVDRVTPVLLWQIERLARRHELHVYVLRYHDRPRTYSLLGSIVHDLGRPQGFRAQYGATLGAVRTAGRPDVLHGFLALPAGVVAAAVGRRIGVPAIVTCDSGEFIGLPDIGYGAQLRFRQRAAVRAMARLARCVTAGTEYQARLARACGVDARVIPMGVDPARFEPPHHPIEDGPPWRLLHVASLNAVKDQRTLLAAFRTMLDRGLDVRLEIAGEDTLGGAIQRYAGELAIGSRVTFRGNLPTAELAAIYRRAHVFVLSSRHDAAPVVALEAAASGLPIAGTAVGYVADWAGERAIAVPAQSPGALADAVAALIGDPGRRGRLAASARHWVLGHDADWTASQFERLYHEVHTP